MPIKVCNDREEWLTERQPTIGASDASTLFGLAMYRTQTVLRLYASKKGLLPVEKNRPEWLEAGHRMEPVIADWWWDAVGKERFDHMSNPGEYTLYRHENGVMHCTPDRLLHDEEGNVVATLQLKNIGSHMRVHWGEGEVPLAIQAQCQHEMMCVGVEDSYVAGLIGGQKLIWDQVQPLVKFQSTLEVKCRAFMRCVAEGTEPPAVAQDIELLAVLFPECRVGVSVEIDPDEDEHLDIMHHVEMLDKVKEEIKVAEGGKMYHEARVKAFMKDAELLILPDDSQVIWKHQKKKTYTVEGHMERPIRRKAAPKKKGK